MLFNKVNGNSIEYEILETAEDHGKIMPLKCSLNIKNDIINLDLKIETINYHYIGILATHYWRYHVKYTGNIQIKSDKFSINKNEITEYLKFF